MGREDSHHLGQGLSRQVVGHREAKPVDVVAVASGDERSDLVGPAAHREGVEDLVVDAAGELTPPAFLREPVELSLQVPPTVEVQAATDGVRRLLAFYG